MLSQRLSINMNRLAEKIGYSQALTLSIVLHIGILVFLSLSFVFNPSPVSSQKNALNIHQQNDTPIIEATALDEADVQKTVDRINAQAARKADAQAAQQANLRAQLQQALKAKQQQQAKVAKLQAAKKHLQQENAEQKSREKIQAKTLAQLKKSQAEQAASAKAAAKATALKQAQLAKAQKAQVAATAHQAAIENKYAALIRSAIERNWTYPNNTDKRTCLLALDLAPTGQVLSAHLIKSSGDPSIDRLAVAAVYKSSPLPVPSDPTDFAAFRHINLTVSTHNE